jgi:cell pole-organizing protein PopZ
MSDEKAQQPEPTMEEILASIRRIIADDDESISQEEANADEAHTGEAAASEEEDFGDDVLDLVEKVDEPVDTAAEAGEPEPEVGPQAEPEDAAPEVEDEPVAEDAGEQAAPVEKPDPAEPVALSTEAEPASPGADESIMSAAAAAAATNTFTELAKAMDREPETVGNVALGTGNTLEDLVKEMVRPMLKEWLDQNLPALVRHLVKKEIQRMVNRSEDI